MKKNKLLSTASQFFMAIGLCAVFAAGCKKQADPEAGLESATDKSKHSISADWGCANHLVTNTVESPAVKMSTSSGGSLNAGKDNITWSWTGIANSAALTSKYLTAFQAVDSAASTYGVPGAPSLFVEIKRYPNNAFIKKPFPHLNSTNFLNRKDGYLIETSAGSPDKVTIHAVTMPGIVNALGTLESRIKANNGMLERGLITDWPDLKSRGFHLVIKNITPNVAKAAIDRMRLGHYNLLILGITNNVKFQTLVNRGLADDCSWTTSEFMDVVNYARKSGIEVVPELRLLSHQQDFMSPVIPGTYASLMWPDGSEKTYNPDSSRVYTDFVYPYIDDVVSVMDPSAIHIGHDEVFGIHGSETPASNTLPASKFMQDVIAVNNYIKGKGKSTMMWGDMLIKASEFPNMHPGSLNGNTSYVAERSSLPADIIICDWHYREKNPQGNAETFPSMLMYASTNEVYGVTFDTQTVIREFSRYAGDNYSNDNIKGMIATAWARIVLASSNNPKATDNWVAFDAIVSGSAEAFWNKPPAP